MFLIFLNYISIFLEEKKRIYIHIAHSFSNSSQLCSYSLPQLQLYCKEMHVMICL